MAGSVRENLNNFTQHERSNHGLAKRTLKSKLGLMTLRYMQFSNIINNGLF